MQNRREILLVSTISILALIALIEGIALLRYSTPRANWTALASKAIASLRDLAKNNKSQTKDAFMENEDIAFRETAENIQRIQNQIDRLFQEMSPRPNSDAWNATRDRQFPFLPPDGMQRLQAEIEHIFQRAHDSQRNGALHLIEQDWHDVGEISSLNLEEEGTNYVVTVSMPGFDKNNINVNLNGRLLTIEAGVARQQAAHDPRTICSGRFKTQIMLPDDINGESTQAYYRDGILQIKIPKTRTSNSLAHKVTIM